MDAKYSADIFKHLEKQSDVLMESYRAMSHELHGLQVEEEMLMRKLYELMSAEGLIKKGEKAKDSCQVDVRKKVEKDSDQVEMHKEKEKDSDKEYSLPSWEQSDEEDSSSED